MKKIILLLATLLGLLTPGTSHAIFYAQSEPTMTAFNGTQVGQDWMILNGGKKYYCSGLNASPTPSPTFVNYTTNNGTLSPTPTFTNTPTVTATNTVTNTATNTATVTTTATFTTTFTPIMNSGQQFNGPVTANGFVVATTTATPGLFGVIKGLIQDFTVGGGIVTSTGLTYTPTSTPVNTNTPTPTITPTPQTYTANQAVTYSGDHILGFGPTFTPQPAPAAVGVTIVSLGYQLPSGTGSGSGTTGSFTKYPINTTFQNDGSVAGAISSNQWTLAAGTYKVINGGFIISGAGTAAFRLYNVTDSAVAAYSLSGFANNGSSAEGFTCNMIAGQTFTIAGTKTFEIDYIIGVSNSNCLGFPASYGGLAENYGFITLQKTN